MTKVSIEILRVSKGIKLKLALIVKDDETPSNQKGQGKKKPLIDKFEIRGNEYIQITPYPFVTLDIASKKLNKSDGFNPNGYVNMNRRDLYIFTLASERLLRRFREEKALFYYNKENELSLDNQSAMKVQETFICGGKTLLLRPCIVEDSEFNKVFEGVVICINTMDNFGTMTASEFEYLVYELRQLDITSISIQLINMYKLMEYEQGKHLEVEESIVMETKDEEIADTSNLNQKDGKEIPNI